MKNISLNKMVYLSVMASIAFSACDESGMIVLLGSGDSACAKCRADQTCEAGVCKDKPEDPCAKCTENQTCEAGVCKDKPEDPCVMCTENQTCEDGECKDKPKDPCDKCGADQTCEAGVCVDKPEDPCAKCTENQTCEDGVCKDKPEDPCAKCGEDQICMDGECKAKPSDPCVKCGADQICEDGVCKDKPIDDPCAMCPESCDGIKCSDICTDNGCASGCTCPEGEKCNGKICVETCNLNERRCSEDSTTLERCKEDETWGEIRCQKWDYCSQEFGNVCVHKLAENVEGGECKEGASICASNTELLVCVNGAFVSKDCKIAKTGVSADRMRCTINNSGGAECVELLGGNTDECAYDEVGYLRCAGQNKGVRKCNPSDGKWKWIGGNCGGENKCIYVFEDDRAAAVCEDGCVEETYECDDNKIMKCVNKKWRVITNCSDFGSMCESDTESAHCQ